MRIDQKMQWHLMLPSRRCRCCLLTSRCKQGKLSRRDDDQPPLCSPHVPGIGLPESRKASNLSLSLRSDTLESPLNPVVAIAVMSSRAGLRFFSAFRQQAARSGKPFAQRRAYQSAAETNVDPPLNQSKFQQFWASPVGPKTVHFWYAVPSLPNCSSCQVY